MDERKAVREQQSQDSVSDLQGMVSKLLSEQNELKSKLNERAEMIAKYQE